MSKQNSNNGSTTTYGATEEATLTALRKLGSARVTEDAIKRGPSFVIPEAMSVRQAVTFLVDYEKANETVHRYSRTFNYRPWDVAAAFDRAVRIVTGAGGIGITQPATFFSPEEPPERRTIKIGPGTNDTIEVPWGEIAVPILGAKVYMSGTRDEELGPLGQIIVDAPKKRAPEVEGLFALIAKELADASIYRGKAITANDDPDFLDVRTLDASKIVFSQQTENDFGAHVLAVIEHAEVLRGLGEPTKRAVLAEGPYGTGKTSMLMIAAQRAMAKGWTVIHVRPGRDDAFQALQTAKLYADDLRGALVLIEDVDTFSQNGDPEAVSRLLDAFDGIEAKGAPIIAMLTTNHPDRIHKGMLRPGRLDAVIHVGDLDGIGVLRLIRVTVPLGRLADELLDHDMEDTTADLLGVHADGMPPAFVREAIGRALRYAVARSGDADTLTLVDFTDALDSLRPQLALMNDADEGKSAEPLVVALERVVRHAVGNADMTLSDGVAVGGSSHRGLVLAQHNESTKREPLPAGA